MTFSLLFSIVVSFMLLFAILFTHATYLRTKNYYHVKLVNIQHRDVEILNASNELINLTKQNKIKYAEERNICGIDSTKDCTLCDDKCLFKKEGIK